MLYPVIDLVEARRQNKNLKQKTRENYLYCLAYLLLDELNIEYYRGLATQESEVVLPAVVCRHQSLIKTMLHRHAHNSLLWT